MVLTTMHLRVEAADGSVAEEYRIHDGEIEVRQLQSPIADGGADHTWQRLSSEQLTRHVQRNTVVAQWLERRLGWHRLLQACVEQNSYRIESAETPADRYAA